VPAGVTMAGSGIKESDLAALGLGVGQSSKPMGVAKIAAALVAGPKIPWNDKVRPDAAAGSRLVGLRISARATVA
jgi:hypothetical protein